MVWDYSEANAFGGMAGDLLDSIKNMMRVVDQLPNGTGANSHQEDAQCQTASEQRIVSTDPPYYDNIGYADLSDYFYVWLRRSLRSVLPGLFSTMVVPKAEELIATPYRHGTKAKAEAFFMNGMTQTMKGLAEQGHPGFPTTIYYAFKQSENRNERGIARTGWETFLEAVITAGLAISGTWPMRTELGNRMIGMGANALASSVVLVCRKRLADAPIATRRDFIAALKGELPPALSQLQRGNIAPVDLAQAAIGPGMAVYTRYAKVLDATRQSRFSRRRTRSHQRDRGRDPCRAGATSMPTAGGRWRGSSNTVSTRATTASRRRCPRPRTPAWAEWWRRGSSIRARGARFGCGGRKNCQPVGTPREDDRLTTWEMVHHLIRVLATGGESAAAELVRKLGGFGEVARELCYRLYTVCERKKRATEALAYNGLVQSWPEISRLARMEARPEQAELFAGGGTEGTR